MRLLHIERDAALATSVALILDASGVKVLWADCAEEGLDLAKRYDFDVILLEPAGLALGGETMLRRLRDAKVATPVLVLSRTNRMDETVALLHAGADDHMIKPFHPAELVARVVAVARRGRGHAEAVVRIGDLEVRVDGGTASMCGVPLHLTRKEFAILELLALRKGAVMTKEMILDHLYGGMDEPEMKIVDVFVCKLRKKIAAIAGHGAIETVWGRGYVLREAAGAPTFVPPAAAVLEAA